MSWVGCVGAYMRSSQDLILSTPYRLESVTFNDKGVWRVEDELDGFGFLGWSNWRRLSRVVSCTPLLHLFPPRLIICVAVIKPRSLGPVDHSLMRSTTFSLLTVPHSSQDQPDKNQIFFCSIEDLACLSITLSTLWCVPCSNHISTWHSLYLPTLVLSPQEIM